MREQIIRQIRLWKADLVLAPRPNDYHPDHRYTGVLRAGRRVHGDRPERRLRHAGAAQEPGLHVLPGRLPEAEAVPPDVAVSIDDIFDKKIDMLDAHVSQFYEWLPWLAGMLENVPKGAADRKRWLKETGEEQVSAAVRETLTKWYGAERAKSVRYAEAFEICRYGTRPDEAMIRKLFPFLK